MEATKTIVFEGNEIIISGVYSGTKKALFDDGNNTQARHHIITVETVNGEIEFDFFTSIAEPSLDENGLISALGCALSDANCGEMEFAEFCNEMGYEQYDETNPVYDCGCDGWDECSCDFNNKKAKDVHEACEDTREKFNSIDLDNNDLYNFLNESEEYQDYI